MFGSQCTASPSCNCSSALGALDSSALELQCYHFLVQGLALSTRSSYLSGQKKFYNFCSQLGKAHPFGSPCPTDEWTLCLFATFLANTVKHSTIKVYLSAVRLLHIEQGFADPLVECLRLRRVLRGIKRTQGDSSSLRLLVTDDVLMMIFHALDLSLPDHCMFWAACLLSIWESLIWPLTSIRHHHAYGFGLRPPKQIHSQGLFPAH